MQQTVTVLPWERSSSGLLQTPILVHYTSRNVTSQTHAWAGPFTLFLNYNHQYLNCGFIRNEWKTKLVFLNCSWLTILK